MENLFSVFQIIQVYQTKSNNELVCFIGNLPSFVVTKPHIELTNTD